jgi:hypothetical protein
MATVRARCSDEGMNLLRAESKLFQHPEVIHLAVAPANWATRISTPDLSR